MAQTKVDYARAMKEDALGMQATVQKDIRALDIKLAEMERMEIRAPRDGTIFRMPVFERGMAIKEGSELFTIVPETTDLAVELWIKGNDVPLVRTGDHVRLQFEGWPAVQFAGWPSVAVGTFGGQVVAIDETDNGKGKFRLQVRPGENTEWPSHRFLRQGVRANGWVMLQRVALGYEIWRQLNGFPPVVAEDEPEKTSGWRQGRKSEEAEVAQVDLVRSAYLGHTYCRESVFLASNISTPVEVCRSRDTTDRYEAADRIAIENGWLQPSRGYFGVTAIGPTT